MGKFLILHIKKKDRNKGIGHGKVSYLTYQAVSGNSTLVLY